MDSNADGSAATLTDFLAGFDGQMEDSGLDETPNAGTSQDAPGTPPVEPAAPVDGTQGKAEGEVATTDASKAPVVAGAPDNPAGEAAAPELDLATAVPLTYNVDHQTRTFEDLKVIPGIGGVISADALPKLQQRLSQADHLYEQSQKAYQERQALDAITAWKVTAEDGSVKTLIGREGIEAQRVAHAQTHAALQTLSEALKDPATLASLIGLDKDGNLALNQAALQNVMTRSELNEMRAMQAIRAGMSQAYTSAQAPQQQSLDLAKAAPQIAAHYAQQLGGGVLGDEDKTFLAQQVRGYLRAASPEDVQADPQLKLGETVIDAAYPALVQRMVELKKSSATAATAATQAAKANEARLAGVIAPSKPKAPAAPAPVRRDDPAAKATAADTDFAMTERLLTGRW